MTPSDADGSAPHHPSVAVGRRITTLGVRARRAGRRILATARSNEPQFDCPLCGRTGPFLTHRSECGPRRWAECSHCGAKERHRLQAEVLRRHLDRSRLSTSSRCLQFAPDPLTPVLRGLFPKLETADLVDTRADLRLDLRSLELPDNCIDFFFASHVLEHVDEDNRAIREIRRVLAPGGVAVLPVPIIVPVTVEYGRPNPREEGHVRAPGPDYFDRFRAAFRSVQIITSSDVRQDVQPWVYEDRSDFPRPWCPERPAMAGLRHTDFVPICWK